VAGTVVFRLERDGVERYRRASDGSASIIERCGAARTRMSAGRRIRWVCDQCGDTVQNGEGYITADPSRRPVHWEVLHCACDPRPDVEGVCISVALLRTAEDLVRWTRCLFQTEWFVHSDWERRIFDDVVRQLAPTSAVA